MQIDITVNDIWSDGQKDIAPRSRLFRLEPIGIGSSYVESLTSYISRLATAHSIYVVSMFTQEILPLFGRTYLQSKSRPEGTFWRKALAFNGMGSWAEDMVCILEALTLREDLRYLTLLTYKEVLSPRYLLRRTRAWCPDCLQDWALASTSSNNSLNDESDIYEPLLWTLIACVYCPKHATRLQDHCPYEDCGREIPVLSPRTRPGYCSRCERWLGRNESESCTEGCSINLSTNNRKLLLGVEEMLGAMPDVTSPIPRETIQNRMMACLEDSPVGNPGDLAKQIGISKRSVMSMLDGSQIPQLNTLHTICNGLGTTPLTFLTRGIDTTSINTVSWTSVKRRKHGPSPRPLNKLNLERALTQVLESKVEPPLSMRGIGKQLKYDPSHLHRIFPDLCTRISKRYKNYLKSQKQKRMQELQSSVRKVARDLITHGYRPTHKLMKSTLEKPRIMFEPDAIRALHEVLME